MSADHHVTIHIDKQAVNTTSATLTGTELRALHAPPIGPDRALFLTVPGPGDDQKIGDSQQVAVHEGMHFFSVVSQITPGGASAPSVDVRDTRGLLLESDVRWLDDKGMSWQVTPAPNGGGVLIISEYRINEARYDRASVDLLLMIPKGYNDTPLDMWWVFPHLKLRATGMEPLAADVLQAMHGKTWQRFSRHLTQPWRPGVDDVRGFMTFITNELQADG